jgi:hypothetical protein
LTGAQGAVGAMGPVGITGSQGPQGAPGANGVSMTVTGAAAICNVVCAPMTCIAPAIVCELGVATASYYGTTAPAPPTCTQGAVTCSVPVCRCV